MAETEAAVAVAAAPQVAPARGAATPQVAPAQGEAGGSTIIDRTVFVESLRMSVEKLAQRIKPLYVEKHGEDVIVALVRRRDGYEITFSSDAATQECIEQGFVIESRQYDAVSSSNADVLVNMNPVPAYVDDAALLKKLTELGCQSVGEVKRHQVEGIETGRRKVVVRLPPNMRSLPRAIIVKASNGRDERIEIFHRNQRIRKNTR